MASVHQKQPFPNVAVSILFAVFDWSPVVIIAVLTPVEEGEQAIQIMDIQAENVTYMLIISTKQIDGI